jgi:hypothetical protein
MPSTVLFVIAAIEITSGMVAVALACTIVASAVMAKMFTVSPEYGMSGDSSNANLGNRQQVSPATDNKLPIVYGIGYVGGTVIDLSISSNNQELYYVLALCEVTNTNTGQTPDTITFGNIYYGGKKVIFDSTDQYKVVGLLDESTGETDTKIAGLINIYLYSNGSNTPTNSSQTAIQVMSNANLIYTWDNTKLMSNCAFAIIHLSYNSSAGVTGIQQTKFQVINSRTSTGDCFYDYLINTRYGGAIPASQINTDSLDELTAYSNELFTFTPYGGGSATQARFKFNGIIEPTKSILSNLQDMASCCDCLVKYNEIQAQWGVITQKPTYTIAMALNDSNLVSAIQVTPLDITASFNVAEIKFPDSIVQDSFSTVNLDLAQIAPNLLYPNEPVNKQSINLPLTNNNVTAQYIATRLLKAGREDLQVQCIVNFSGIQLEAGDIVSLTNLNYGWTAKLFRINRVVENFAEDGAVTAKLTLQEFNSAVYDDVNITQFTPASNSGLGSPTIFGTIPAPTVSNPQRGATNPSFQVNITTSSAGITQYAELWYSAFSTPTIDQRFFAGTTEIQSNGTPYSINTPMPAITLANIPTGNWYFFSRMVNSLASSNFSPASSVFVWQPTTIQFTERYVIVAYADDASGGGFDVNPYNKTYYGLLNQSNTNFNTDPTAYKWYLADPAFGTDNYLAYGNRTGRKFSFGSGLAGFLAGGSFVPTQAEFFDSSIFSALPTGTNSIDLDLRTGQLTQVGTTVTGQNSGSIYIRNNNQGGLIGGLQKFLDFGNGVTQKTSAVANLTVDIYGRVVGFEAPDNFYYTNQAFVATANQTVFSVTRGAGYIIDQCFVFQNGCLLDTNEYVDASSTVTLGVGADAGDIITVISMKSVNATTGVYASFTRYEALVSNASEIDVSGFSFQDGYELIFINGLVLNDNDYNVSGQVLNGFPSVMNGNLTIIIWSANNLGQPNGFPNNVSINTIIGQSLYNFSFDANAFNLYNNGVLFKQGTDFTTATGSYTLTNVPTSIANIMTQQAFSRTGAV